MLFNQIKSQLIENSIVLLDKSAYSLPPETNYLLVQVLVVR